MLMSIGLVSSMSVFTQNRLDENIHLTTNQKRPMFNYNFRALQITILATALFLAMPLTGHAFLSAAGVKTFQTIAKISNHTKILTNGEIVKLSKISDEINGTKRLGLKLGKLNLPNEVLEDTFMRIAIHQNKISRIEAEEMFSRLHSTPGFRSALRKVIGNSANKTSGHLNELRIANTASKHGYKVLAIGEKFSDGLKRAPTDIDVILKRNSKIFVIEAKEYKSTTKLDLGKYRADLDTLIQYKKQSQIDVVTIFSITNMPVDSVYLKRLEYEASKRNVQLIFGAPSVQIEKIKLLEAIL